jgi:hypothetical protein
MSSAIVFWTNLSTGLEAVQKFGKFMQAVSLSWETLQKIDHNLEVKRLRKDLLVIAQALREAHFAVGEHKLLPPNDFLALELKSVLAAVEKACADPKLYELEIVIEKASFVQTRVQEKLQAMSNEAAIETNINSESTASRALRRALDRLSANSLMVSQAIPKDSLQGLDFEPRFPDLYPKPSCAAEEYDSAAESEKDFLIDGREDGGYTSCDEDAFWKDAHDYWVGKTHSGRTRVLSQQSCDEDADPDAMEYARRDGN